VWGEAYSYDGFGNLTGKTVTQAPAPALGVSYDANNHQLGLTYDANGNQLWDSGQHATAYGWNMENKLVTQTSQGWPGAETWYSYDPWGRRVMKDVNADPNGQNGGPGYEGGTWEFYFYGITGQKLMTTICTYNSIGQLNCSGGSSYLYFGSRLIQANGSLVVTDRLGSVRAKNTAGSWTQTSYFPWGEERTTTPDGTEKFGTYYRDGPGQDYAEQRYYNNGTGRFWSVDPGGMGAANPSTPISLNRYAYVNGDPVNYGDPSGRILVYAGGGLVLDCGDDATSIFDGSCTGTDGDWGGGGGGGGGGNACSSYENAFLGMPGPPGCVEQNIQPPPPPLSCKFVEAAFDPVNAEPAEGTSGLGWFAESYFGFKASGGTGSYTWLVMQYFSSTITTSDGRTFSRSGQDGSGKELPYDQAGNDAILFEDGPGLLVTQVNSAHATTVSRTVTLDLSVTVTSGLQVVSCGGIIPWFVNISVTNGIGSGTGSLGFQ
jgi:RHS repeat-associated protein